MSSEERARQQEHQMTNSLRSACLTLAHPIALKFGGKQVGELKDAIADAIAKALTDRPVEDGERQRLRSLAKALHETVLLHANDRDKALAERDSLRAQCDALREALTPFAQLKPPDFWADHEGINVHSSGWITAGDIRNARALITAMENENVQEKK